MAEQAGYRRAFRVAYKIFNWVALIGLIAMVALILHKPAMPQIAIDPGAAGRVEQKLAAVDRAKAQGQPANLALDSTELNSYLAQNLELEGSAQTASLGAPSNASGDSAAGATSAPAAATIAASGVATGDSGAASSEQVSIAEVRSSVRDVKIQMDGDLITTYVIFNLHGEDLALELEGHLAAENGYMKFEPVAGKLGSLPLSQSTLNAAVGRLMNSAENREKFRLPDDVSDIRVQDGQVVVAYR